MILKTVQVMGRRPCCDKSKVKRGSWSPEEDATLKNYLHKHGTGGNWIALPQKAGLKRCGKSCRLRWLNYLRPDIKHGVFTQEEENTICNLYFELGSRWSVIASHLPGRTDNDVKNYWNTKLKKKLKAAATGSASTTTTTTDTTIVDKYSLSLPPSFQEQYLPDNNMSFNFPTSVIEGLNGNCTSAPFSQIVEESSPFGQILMDQNYGVMKEVPAMDECSYEVLSGFWSHEDAMGSADGNADLFSIFRVDSKQQGMSQSH